MNVHKKSLTHRALRDQSGQVLPWVAFMMLLFLGLGAFVLDVGHAFYSYRQLQAATDAAAMAGAKLLYSSEAISTATSYGATSGGNNVNSQLTKVSMVPGYPKTECNATLTSMGIQCEGPLNANVIQVKEQALIPTFFAQVIGLKQLTVSTTSTATMGNPTPLNVALVVDTTLSLTSEDSNCGMTGMSCEMQGAQTLMSYLSPSVDYVAMFTFPSLSTSTAGNDSSCSPPPSLNPSNGGNPTPGLATALPYNFPAIPSNPATTGYVPATGVGTYQVTGFSENYRNANSSSPNSSSSLVGAVGIPANTATGQRAVTGCLTSPNNDGMYGTYLPGAIYAAQAALANRLALEMQSSPPITPINIMVILSDGDSNVSNQYAGSGNQFFTPGSYNETGQYPSDVGDCGQEVVAAGVAKTAGTLVYTVAYGSPATFVWAYDPNNLSNTINNSTCPTDANGFFSQYHLGPNVSSYPNITPCQAMQDMASTPTGQYFFSDYNQSGSNSTCYSPNTDAPTQLADIFAHIGGQLVKARLIPDSIF